MCVYAVFFAFLKSHFELPTHRKSFANGNRKFRRRTKHENSVTYVYVMCYTQFTLQKPPQNDNNNNNIEGKKRKIAEEGKKS